MFRKFIVAFVLSFFLMSSSALATEEKRPSIFVSFDGVTAEFKYGTLGYPYIINENGVLFVHGVGQVPKNWNKTDSFSKTFARQAARIDALRNLAECIAGIHVGSFDDPKIHDESFDDPKNGIYKVRTLLEHDNKAFKLLEKDARQVGDVIFSEDGACVLFMAVRIHPAR